MDRFADDWRSAGLDEPTHALMEFAEKLTEEPAAVRPEDVENLRSHGFGDQAISSATQVIAYFNYINRIAEGLGVAHEAWLAPDGRRRDG